jgi:hypothetical protein
LHEKTDGASESRRFVRNAEKRNPVIPMPDILQRLQDAYKRNPAEAFDMLPELMYAIGKTVIELPCKVECQMCKTGKIILNIPQFRAMAVVNQHMDHEAFSIDIGAIYCPYCGRKLEPAEREGGK